MKTELREEQKNYAFKFPVLGALLAQPNEYMANIFLNFNFKDIMDDITVDTELQNKLIFRFKNFLNDVFKVNIKRQRGWTTGMMLYIINKAVEEGELIRQLEFITNIPEKYHYVFNEIFTVIASTRVTEKTVTINNSLSSQLFNIIKIKLETLVNYNKIVGYDDPIEKYLFYTMGTNRHTINNNTEIINIINGVTSNTINLNDYKIVWNKL